MGRYLLWGWCGGRGGRLSSLQGGDSVLKFEDEPLEVVGHLPQGLVLKLEGTEYG